MIFRQLFDARSSTYTYLLADDDSREAVIIDPVYEQARRDAALVRELDLKLLATLDTHVHADHVTGAWLLRRELGSAISVASSANAQGADRGLSAGELVSFGRHQLEVRATPGHTDGCLSYVLDGGAMVFTGDALLIRGAGRTDFQQGDARTLYRSVHTQIFSLPDDCLVFPAHDYAGRTASTVAEERALNPRLGGKRSEADFVGYMHNLGLPHPKQIDVALPANMRCGAPAEGEAPPADPDWAPLRYSYAGIWELDALWLEEHLGEVTLVDVREPEEFEGPLGHIAGATLIPLGELAARVDELPADKPVVAVCRSGGRSTQATVVLRKAGRERVANLAGGMIHWLDLGLKTT
ncbi:MBL fold metallo-hydrolase [Pseudenhygromyxa sp. WMMC2535]|uniref:MBL fold metallo-hydrolase n=1 Tax=Pseudenhygromyxa sp. WMMC2535 TaxID=2712867 RepID=UPI0015564167|nr:MBL fold metallo-hydrolase [Pseudenhygromyxa sp. WMMC2535]